MTSDIKSYRRRLLMECRIAGLAYHNEDHIVDELTVGDKLALVREKGNEHDKNAVAIASACDYEGDPDDFDFRFILGYVPKGENEGIAAMLDMGWADSLEAEVIKVNDGNSLFDKIHIGIFIKSRDEQHYDGTQLWVVRLNPKSFEEFQHSLWFNGFEYQEWGGDAFYEGNLPDDGDRIVYLYQQDKKTILYLLMNKLPKYRNVDMEGPVEEGHKAFYLYNIIGPLEVSDKDIAYLKNDPITEEPNYPLSSKATESLLSLFHNQMVTFDIDDSELPGPTGNIKKTGKKWYVRCQESDGSDHVYKTCDSKEEAQAVIDNQDSNDSLYEHLYIVDHEINDICGE